MKRERGEESRGGVWEGTAIFAFLKTAQSMLQVERRRRWGRGEGSTETKEEGRRVGAGESETGWAQGVTQGERAGHKR